MPVPVPATPPSAVAAQVQTRAENAIVAQVNRMRRSHGLGAVRIDGRLARVARAHSLSMLRHDVLSHGAFAVRLRRTGPRRRFGETLAWAPGRSGSARTVVSLWMHSPPHRAVLLDGSLHRVGVGRWLGAMGAQRGAAITADFSS
jgi:uncharacterized protein YkwD